MHTAEAAFIWPVLFIMIILSLYVAVSCAFVTYKQIDAYSDETRKVSASDVVRIVEVAHETLEDIQN